MSADLLPCPCCGSADVELRESIADEQVACCNCGLRTGFIMLTSSDEANAFKREALFRAWNTRV